jgi:hypothetical protein
MKTRKIRNGINMANLMLIFLIIQAMMGFASFPPYFVRAMLVEMPSRIGKIKNAMPNPMWLIQFGIFKSDIKLRNI